MQADHLLIIMMHNFHAVSSSSMYMCEYIYAHLYTYFILVTSKSSRLMRQPDSQGILTHGISLLLICGWQNYNMILTIYNHIIEVHTITLYSYDLPYINNEINTHLLTLCIPIFKNQYLVQNIFLCKSFLKYGCHAFFHNYLHK